MTLNLPSLRSFLVFLFWGRIFLFFKYLGTVSSNSCKFSLKSISKSSADKGKFKILSADVSGPSYSDSDEERANLATISEKQISLYIKGSFNRSLYVLFYTVKARPFIRVNKYCFLTRQRTSRTFPRFRPVNLHPTTAGLSFRNRIWGFLLSSIFRTAYAA